MTRLTLGISFSESHQSIAQETVIRLKLHYQLVREPKRFVVVQATINPQASAPIKLEIHSFFGGASMPPVKYWLFATSRSLTK